MKATNPEANVNAVQQPPTRSPVCFNRPQNINVIEPTSFLEGAVSMDGNHSGKTFINSKILIDTGALIPTGVAISEDFFTNNMQGKISDLVPSDLNSANGASSNSTMETVGQLEVRIRFNQNNSTIICKF